MEVRFIDRIARIEAAQWNALLNADYPFLRHEFLHALEASGSAVAQQGWQPHHVLVYDAGTLCGCMPLYIKSHPRGEYVFDDAWEHAFARAGLSYYPKLLTAIPFTPVRGPRYLIAANASREHVVDALCSAVQDLVKREQYSSWHVLFADDDGLKELRARQLTVRDGVHFFWRNNNYRDFEDFLATCNARKRKNIRKERKYVAEANICFRVLPGNDLSETDWQFFYRCYRATYAKRSGHGGYLTRAFFEHIDAHFAQHTLMFIAERAGKPIAAALAFRSDNTLYGRYWGCVEHVDKLHFEACYYQEIEYCIAQKIEHFDGGVQGEHKILRGFVPTTTHSCHWIQDQTFRAAIAHYLKEESKWIAQYKGRADEFLPFKKK